MRENAVAAVFPLSVHTHDDMLDVSTQLIIVVVVVTLNVSFLIDFTHSYKMQGRRRRTRGSWLSPRNGHVFKVRGRLEYLGSLYSVSFRFHPYPKKGYFNYRIFT